MDRKKLVVVDTDNIFLRRFKNRLKYNKLSERYEVVPICPDDSDRITIAVKAADQFRKIIESGAHVSAVFVDINLIENRAEYDTSGISLAAILKKEHPKIPVYNITGKVSYDEQLDVFSDATQGSTDGVVTKYYLYEGGFDEARLEKLELLRSQNLLNADIGKEKKIDPQEEGQECDIAILAALYDDEFENIQPLANWISEVKDKTKILHIGEMTFTGPKRKKRTIRIVASHQLETGMVDAAIFATEMITKYKPQYLIMTGVCGGKNDKDIELGDIVIAKKVFTFQKGIFTEDGFEHEGEECKLDGKIMQQIKERKKEIVRKVMDSDPSRASKYGKRSLRVQIKPMACSTAVVNREGLFDDEILVRAAERNAMAVDMESYGVARACELANEGNTKAIIVKSVMDKTKEKDDEAKSFAGFTSAEFIKCLIEDVLYRE